MTDATVTVLWAWPGMSLRSNSAEASTPPWLADTVMVERALEAKGESQPGPHFWRGLANLLCLVDGVLQGDIERVDHPVRLLTELAASLPDPWPPDYDPRTIGVVAARPYRPHPTEDIAACVTLLAAELSNPQSSHLSGLASVLDELAMALLLYQPPAPNRSTPRIVAPEATVRSSLLISAATAGSLGTTSKNVVEPNARTSQRSETSDQHGAPKS